MVNLFNTTHSKSKTRIYRIWASMKTRCYCKSDTNYKKYGAKGITVCDEWKSDFMSFYNWAYDNGYDDTLSIERLDNNLGYSPSNCKWIPQRDQSLNRRICRKITVNGVTKLQKEWARDIGRSDVRLIQVRNSGKNVEEYIANHLKQF